MPPDGGKEGGKEGGLDQGGAKKGVRGKVITFPELMCCMWDALGTNERFSNGNGSAWPLLNETQLPKLVEVQTAQCP